MVYFSRFGLLYPEKNVATRCNYARLVSKQQHGKFKTVRNSGIRTHDHLENFESDAGERTSKPQLLMVPMICDSHDSFTQTPKI
jgi:hypothetical protein